MKICACLALLACAASLAACNPPPPTKLLDADDVREQAQALQSISAESDLLARQLAAHAVNRAFAWVQQQALAQDAAKASEQLARPAPPELRAAQEQALQIAARLQDRINRLAQARAQPDTLALLRREFAALKSQAGSLEHAP
jgi:hypothetical protein